MRSRLSLAAAVSGLIAVALATSAIPGGNSATADVLDPNNTANIQILSINDLHGNLEPPAGSSGRVGTINAGGAEYLATHVRNLKNTNKNTLIVSAGDLIGASPLLSALFDDEPTIDVASAIGVDMAGVGNHEFDRGVAELKRIDKGGCKPNVRCQNGIWQGSPFPFIAANVLDTKSGQTILPAWYYRDLDGVRVGFIGLTLKDTPTIVTPSGVAGLEFKDEVEVINSNAAILRQRGANAIVVAIHQGGRGATGAPNECKDFTGPIIDIVKKTSKIVDAYLTAHTHEGYNCIIDGKPVMQGASFGRLVTKLDLVVQRGQDGRVVSAKATNVIVTRDVPKAADITTIIDKYKRLSAPRANRVLGSIAATFDRVSSAGGETTLGDLIADSQLAATRDAALGGAQVALMNPGGIRTDLVYEQISGGEATGQVTYAEAFAVQPFGNNLMTITVTGAQLKTVLEQQFDNPTPGTQRILQVSKGFTYTYSKSAPLGSKVDASSIKIDGKVVDPATKYRITVNSFLADGGDSFLELAKGTERLGGAVDIDALEKYLISLGTPAALPTLDRIVIKP